MPDYSHIVLDRRRLLQVAGTAFLAASPPREHALAQATPAAGSSTGHTSLVDMVRLIPATLLNDLDGSGLWDYMDLAQQLASLGVPEATIESPLPLGHFEAIYPLWTSAAAYRSASMTGPDASLLTGLAATIGFFPLAIGQCLSVGSAPNSVSIYRGGFDLDRLTDAWSTHAYQPVAIAGGGQYWTLGEWNGDDPIQRHTFGELNNLAVIDDMVVAAGEPAMLARVLDARHTGEPSILDNQEIGDTIAGMPAETVSAIGAWPSFVPMVPDEAFMATQTAIAEASGPMPLYLMIVAGVTAGLAAPTEVDGTPTPFEPAPGAGLVVVRLATATEADARQAARVAAERWQAGASLRTKRPFTDSMEVRSAEAVGTVAELVFDHVRRPRAWQEIFLLRDNFPFAVG